MIRFLSGVVLEMCIFLLVQSSFALALHVDSTYGTVVETFHGDKADLPYVYVIEDAHCHPEVQYNIYMMLQRFIDNSDQKIVVGIEGAYVGLINTDSLHVFDDDARNKIVFDEMFKDGRLSAAEYLHVREGNFYLYGLEDAALYKENLKQYSKYIDTKEIQVRDLDACKEKLKIIESLVMPAEYVKFLEKVAVFYDSRSSDLLADLFYYADLYSVPFRPGSELATLFALQKELEKIDNKALQDDIERFKKKTHRDFSLDAGLKQLSSIEADELDSFFALKKYLVLKEKLETLSSADFFNEVDDAIHAIMLAIAPDNDAREFLAQYQKFESLHKLLNLAITPHEYAEYSKTLTQESVDDLEKYIASFFPAFALESDMPSLLTSRGEFYSLARERDEIMIQNAFKGIHELSLGPLHSMVLIVGGFHTGGIKKSLEARGCSFSIIRPVVTGNSERFLATYFQVLKEVQGVIAE
jgi:hypothetical protein